MMDCAALIRAFDGCFAGPAPHTYDRARLVRGGEEPLFLPAGRDQPIAEVIFARDLPQSCLHEAAHWLQASSTRRQLVDYGYWYAPDGRDAEAQKLFEAHEAEVQALERMLSEAAGVAFTISCDNLARPEPSPSFIAAIDQAYERRLLRPASPRVERFLRALRLASIAEAEKVPTC